MAVSSAHLRRSGPVGATVLVGVLVLLLLNFLKGERAGHASNASAPAKGGADIVLIDPQIGETFAPAADDVSAPLTAVQAFAKYARANDSDLSQPPAGMSSQIGYLTLPTGPNSHGDISYTADNQLVWAYSWASCPINMGPGSDDTKPQTCKAWLFLDARTAIDIDQTWQQ